MTFDDLPNKITRMDLQPFIAQLSHPALIVNFDLEVLAINNSGRACIGQSEDGAIHWDKGLGCALKPVLLMTIETGVPQEDIFTAEQDGQLRPRLFTSQVMQLMDQSVIFAQSLPLTDHALQRLDKEAAVTAERVALALRSRRVGFWDWNIKDDILTWDKTQYEIFGVKPGDFKNAYEAWVATLSPEFKERGAEEVRAALAGERPYNAEFEIVTPAGEKRTIRGSGICFWDEQGKPQRLIGLNWDVTSRRKLERQFFDQARLTQKIAEMIPASITVGDIRQDRIRYFNQRYCETYGLDPEVVRRSPYSLTRDFVHPDDQERFQSYIQKIRGLTDGQVAEAELQIVDALQVRKYIRLQTQIFERGADGQLSAIITAAVDITAEKERERSAESDRAKAFNSSKLAALGQMAGGIAHEINNPLTIIVAKIEQIRQRLLKESDKNAKTAEDAERIVQMCQRIAKIIRSMRTVSRSEDSEVFQPMSLQNVIDDVMTLSNQRLTNLSIKMTWPIAPNLMMELRPIQISQILLNLLNNAIDAVIPLSEKWIHIGLTEQNGFVDITVTDSGPGIPPKIAERMSEPFFTTKPVGKGTGLGLSISISMAEQHGGSLIYDPSHKNTRFVLRIPKSQNQKTKDPLKTNG